MSPSLGPECPPPNQTLEAALAYAARGWPVVVLHTPLPGGGAAACSCGKPDCSSIGKHPRTAHGVKDATTDPTQIRDWWRRWPNANIGVATGPVSGVFALDIDPRNGGEEGFDDLRDAHGKLPDTVEAITGGRGRHILFKYPLSGVRIGNRSSKGALARGVDVKGDGGYIVVEPSLHASGREYGWEASSHPEDVPIADAPAWLLALVTGKPSPVVSAPAAAGVLAAGGRNNALFVEAAALRGKGSTEGAILAALRASNLVKCSPPLDDTEVQQIAASASRYAPGAVSGSSSGSASIAPGTTGVSSTDITKVHTTWPTASARAATVGGASTRLQTPISTLNAATRGGLPMGKFVVLGGAPGSGKTTLGVQLIRHFALAGIPVGVLACDETAEATMIRWGQQAGVGRAALEDGIPSARLLLQQEFDRLPFVLFADAADPGASIEALSVGLKERAGRPGVLFFDSIQTTPSILALESFGARDRIDKTVAALKAATRLGHLGIATCELARSAYRSKNATDNVEDIAAFKESSAVEYGADLLLVLRADKDSDAQFDIAMPKNRCGRKLPFRLELDFTLDTFREIAMPAKATPQNRLAGDMARIRELLIAEPGIPGFAALTAKLGIGKDRGKAALAILEEQGEISNRGNKARPRLYLEIPQVAALDLNSATRPNSAEPASRVSEGNSATRLPP